MKKIYLFFFLFSFLFITCPNHSYGFSICKIKTGNEGYEALQYMRISEFVKLSASQLGDLRGRKMSTWKKLSFSMLKMRMKHVVKKSPGLLITDFFSLSRSPFKKRVLFWIIFGLLALIFLFILIFGLAPR